MEMRLISSFSGANSATGTNASGVWLAPPAAAAATVALDYELTALYHRIIVSSMYHHHHHLHNHWTI